MDCYVVGSEIAVGVIFVVVGLVIVFQCGEHVVVVCDLLMDKARAANACA